MALINNIYVLAEKEDKEGDVELTTHPTESGFPITDSVRKQAISISISGKIADTENLTAKQAVEKLEKLRDEGSVVKYIGQCGTFNNLQIQSFKPSYSHKNFGGADFSMTLNEFKTAKSAYVAPDATLSQKITSSVKEPTVGSTVKFLGGYVYVSSDATIHSAKRGASTCLLTHISTLENANHKYHLISKDCTYGSSNYVYGWVDAESVEGNSSTTNNSTNGGTQQVQGSNKTVIYHTVKKGETIWGLVNKTYKSYGFWMYKVINDNPSAFSTPGKATTLKVGARLKLQK